MNDNYELEIDLTQYTVKLDRAGHHTTATIKDCYGSILGNLDPSEARKEEQHNATVFYTSEENDYAVKAFPVLVHFDSEKEQISFEAGSEIKEEDLIDAIASHISDEYDAIQEIGYESLTTLDRAWAQASSWNEKYGTLATETNIYKETKITSIKNDEELQYKYSNKDSMVKELFLLEKEISDARNPIMGGVENAHIKEKEDEEIFLQNAIEKETELLLLQSGMIFKKGNEDNEENRQLLVNFEEGKWNKSFLKNIGREDFLNNEKSTCFLYEDEAGLSQMARLTCMNKKEILFSFEGTEDKPLSTAFLLSQIENLAKGKKTDDELRYKILDAEETGIFKIKKEQGILESKKLKLLETAPLALKETAKEFLSIAEGFFEDITKYDVPTLHQGWHSLTDSNKKDSDIIIGIRKAGTTIVNLNIEDFGEDIKGGGYSGMPLEDYANNLRSSLFVRNNERFFIIKDGYENHSVEISKNGASQAIDIFEQKLKETLNAVKEKTTDLMALGEKIFSERLRTSYSTKDEFIKKLKKLDNSLSQLTEKETKSVWEAKTAEEIGLVLIGKEVQKHGKSINNDQDKYNNIEMTTTESGLYLGIEEMKESTKKEYTALLSEILPKEILQRLDSNKTISLEPLASQKSEKKQKLGKLKL